MLLGVLGGDHHEGRVEGVRVPVDRDLAIAHRLEQRALGAGGRPVDLVGQHQVGEDGPRVERKLTRARVQHRDPHDVRRQQIARELDAVKRPPDRRRQRPHQRGLAHPRHVLDQQVPPPHQRDHRVPDGERLPPYDAGHVGLQRRDELSVGGRSLARESSAHPHTVAQLLPPRKVRPPPDPAEGKQKKPRPSPLAPRKR